MLTGDRLQRCPIRTLQLLAEQDPALSDELDRYLDDYYPAYVDGFLLVEGGLSDQPARYVDLIGRIRQVDSRVQERYLELTKKDTDG